MNVVYMGTPDFAVPALKALHSSRHTALAVVTGPDKPSGRGRKLQPTPVRLAAEELSLKVLTPTSLKDSGFVSQLRDIGADLFAVIAFRILPEAVFTLPKFGSINIHASLLPKYRGAAPIQRALMNGETQSGLSAFLLEKSVDTGGVIAQLPESIQPDDTYSTLAARLSQLAGKFLVETIDALESGSARPVKQDDEQATPAPKIMADERIIDWRRPATEIVNQIRGLSEFPGAYSDWRGKRMQFLGAKLALDSNVSLAPGEARICGKKILIGAGDGGAIEPQTCKPEGKKALSASELINGQLIVSGEKLGISDAQ